MARSESPSVGYKANSRPLDLKTQCSFLLCFRYLAMVGLTFESLSAMKRDVQTVAEWDFARIIPCHGDVLDSDVKRIWLDALKSHL